MALALAFELKAGDRKKPQGSWKEILETWRTTREKGFMMKILCDSKIMTGVPSANLCHYLSILTKNLLSSSKLLEKIYSTVIEYGIISTFPYLLFIFMYYKLPEIETFSLKASPLLMAYKAAISLISTCTKWSNDNILYLCNVLFYKAHALLLDFQSVFPRILD